MLRLLLLAVCVSCSALFQQCNSFYATATPYTPIHDGRNDLNSNLSIGAGGLNAAITYSPFNHVYTGSVAHAFLRDREYCYSVAPVLGYYHNSADGNFHLDLQLGYLWGKSDYGGFGVSGRAAFQSTHFQLFVAHRVGKRKNGRFGLGGALDFAKLHYSRMHYDYSGPDILAEEVRFGGIFIFLEQHIEGVPEVKFFWQLGLQYGMADVGSPDDFTLYQPLIFRFGISYQFHPFSRKRE